MKAFDLSKFKKKFATKLGVNVGFHDPKTWMDSGCYAINKIISGSYFKGFPLDGKVSVVSGISGCLPEEAKVTIRYKEIQNSNWKTLQDTTVKNLKEIWDCHEYEIQIDTPDGWQKIVNWFNKGKLPCVEVTTFSNSTVCATNHLIETITGWKNAIDLTEDDVAITRYENEQIINVEDKGTKECYDFEVDHPNHRYWGDNFSSHNSGKSYLVSGNVVKWCQNNGVLVILMDSETAVDRSWIKALGVNPDDEKTLMRVPVSSPDDCAAAINEIMNDYIECNKDLPQDEQQKMLFIIDSLSMLQSKIDQDQFATGDMRGSIGGRARQNKSLLSNMIQKFSGHQVGGLITAHVYSNQNQYSSDQFVLSGGSGVEFIASIVLELNKLKMKENEDGTEKSAQQLGIRSKMTIKKSRYSKPGNSCEIFIPYDKGMSPYSGLFEMFEKQKLFEKVGNRWAYADVNGEVHTYFRKEWINRPELLHMVMVETDDKDFEKNVGVGMDIIPTDNDEE